MGKTNNRAKQVVNSGKSYGKWDVVKVDVKRFDYVLCKCECGQERSVNVYSLTSGKSRSCGCGVHVEVE